MAVAGKEGLQVLRALALRARLQRLFTRGLADAVDDLVLEDADEPGTHGRLPGETCRALDGGEQGVLHRIFGGGAVAQLQEREAQ
jgi:hypothetical protein